MCCTKATLRAPAGREVGVRLQCYNQPNPTDVEAGVPWEHARQSLRDQAQSRPLAYMQANSTPASKKPARRHLHFAPAYKIISADSWPALPQRPCNDPIRGQFD